MTEYSWDLLGFWFAYLRRQSDFLELYRYFKGFFLHGFSKLVHLQEWFNLWIMCLHLSGDYVSVSHVWLFRAKVSPSNMVPLMSWHLSPVSQEDYPTDCSSYWLMTVYEEGWYSYIYIGDFDFMVLQVRLHVFSQIYCWLALCLLDCYLHSHSVGTDLIPAFVA